MERIRVPAGTAQKFEDVFKRLQDVIKVNIDKRIITLFKKFGVTLLTENMSASDPDWKPEVVDFDARTMRINVGSSNVAYGISKGGDMLELHGAIETPLSAGSGSNEGDFAYHVIFIEKKNTYADPVPVVDGFLFDESGETAQAMTSINDS